MMKQVKKKYFLSFFSQQKGCYAYGRCGIIILTLISNNHSAKLNWATRLADALVIIYELRDKGLDLIKHMFAMEKLIDNPGMNIPNWDTFPLFCVSFFKENVIISEYGGQYYTEDIHCLL